MRVLKLVLEYDGTAYCGWQIQATGPTIQGILEEKLEVLTGGPARVVGSGRTDAGVHAFMQVVSFRTESPRPADEIRRALNALLPRDIAVQSVVEAPADFDARRSARGKVYRYQIWNAWDRSVFHDRFAWHIARPLDVAAMRAGAAELLGEHDFSSFRAADCPAKHPVRVLRRAEVDDSHKPLLRIEVEATAFLKHMVRNIVGTLVEVGRGRRTPESVGALLAARDRRQAGETAPAKGLILLAVHYP